MSFEKKNILEVVGIVAVVGSLIFVGMQLRLDRDVARFALYHQALEQMSTAVYETDYADLSYRYPDLEDSELSRLELSARTVIFAHELIYDMYQNGLIDEDHWTNILDNNLEIISSPLYMSMLRSRPGILSRRLLSLLEEYQQE